MAFLHPGGAGRRARLARTVLIPLAALALGGWRAAPAADSATLEGTWRLVEQRYASGGHNLAAEELRLLLRIGPPGSGGPGSREVTLEALGGEGAAETAGSFAWPAFVTDEGARQVRLLAREAKDAESCLRARFEVRPSDADGLTLRIEEQYCLAEDGRSLKGAMTVLFLQDSEQHGSFVLHRRFEREP